MSCGLIWIVDAGANLCYAGGDFSPLFNFFINKILKYVQIYYIIYYIGIYFFNFLLTFILYTKIIVYISILI